jgi:ATPase subunit of ABC transporter with duplicated ATPase domains
VLLNKTPFFLERGHRYGLIGQNGVGKTTLLTRIAAGDINNFPKDVSCYYIQHEILAEEGTSVSTFMLGQVRALTPRRPVRAWLRDAGCLRFCVRARTRTQVPEGCSHARIIGALDAVGFSEERQAAAVSELSGGWRMKLAIARSMLWDAGELAYCASWLGVVWIRPRLCPRPHAIASLPQTCSFWTSRRTTWTRVPSSG